MIIQLQLPTDDCGKHDEGGFARLPQDWVGVIHISEGTGGNDDCPLVIDRVREAFYIIIKCGKHFYKHLFIFID